MHDQSQNPFAAPTEVADADAQRTVSRRLPADTYFYVAVVFFIGCFGGLFVASFFTYFLPQFLSLFVVTFASMASGLFAASRMYKRLADIHERKVAWEIQQSEWANGIG